MGLEYVVCVENGMVENIAKRRGIRIWDIRIWCSMQSWGGVLGANLG